MPLSKLREHHLLTGALPPRGEDEHAFMVANGHCEACYGKLPNHADLNCPLLVAELHALAVTSQPAPAADVFPPMHEHVSVPLISGTPIKGVDMTPDPPPPPR